MGRADYYELVLVASDSLVNDNADLIRRFLRATVQGYGAAMGNHAKALAALFKESPEADKQMETKAIELLAPEWVDKSGRFGFQDPVRWEAYTKWMQSHGLPESRGEGLGRLRDGSRSLRPCRVRPLEDTWLLTGGDSD